MEPSMFACVLRADMSIARFEIGDGPCLVWGNFGRVGFVIRVLGLERRITLSEVVVVDRVQIQEPSDLRKRIVYFVTEYLNRGFRVREAVLEGIKRTQDSYGSDAEFQIGADFVESLVTYFERAVETYRSEEAAGRHAVGHGIYAEVVSDDDYLDRMVKKSE